MENKIMSYINEKIVDYLPNNFKGAIVAGSALAVFGLGGCAGMGSGIKYDHDVPKATSVAYSSARANLSGTNPTDLEKMVKERMKNPAQADSYEKILKPFVDVAFQGASPKDLDYVDGVTGEKVPTQDDEIAANYSNMVFGNNISLKSGTKQFDISNLAGYSSKNSVRNALAKKYDAQVFDHGGASVFFPEGNLSYPRMNGPLSDVVDDGVVGKIKSIVGDATVEMTASYAIKQGGRVIGTMTLYDFADDKMFRPTIMLRYNSFILTPNFEDKVKDSEEVSHRLKDRARGRQVLPLLTGGAAAAITGSAAVGVADGLASLYMNNEFGKVIQFTQSTLNSPAEKLGENKIRSLLEPSDNGHVVIDQFYFITQKDGSKKIGGLANYNLSASVDDVILGENDITVSVDQKFLALLAKNAGILGTSVGFYELGKNSADNNGGDGGTGTTGGRDSGTELR
jgi:hypothetical protein